MQPRRSKSGSAAAAAALAALAIAAACAAACSKEQGSLHRCACTFVTDTDDDTRHDVEVCAPSADRAPAVARGCAQTGAPGPIARCDCAAAAPPQPCEVGVCRMIER